MEIERLQMSRLLFAIKGQNRGLIQISEDRKTGSFVIVVGKGIRRRRGVLNLPQGLWRVTCKKEEVKEAVLMEEILID